MAPDAHIDEMSRGRLVALIVTLVIEVPLVVALFAGQRRRLAVVAVLANTFTKLFLPGEIFAVGFETAAYALLSRPRDWPRALLASSLGNLLSYQYGFWLARLLLT